MLPARARHRAAADGQALEQDEQQEDWPPRDRLPALTGELAEIEGALQHRDVNGALAKARDWHAREPGDVLALIGARRRARGAWQQGHRGARLRLDHRSVPGRADLRRFAGERLARLDDARDSMIDTYRRAVADRPDHLTGHRLLAYALAARAASPATRSPRSSPASTSIIPKAGSRAPSACSPRTPA